MISRLFARRPAPEAPSPLPHPNERLYVVGDVHGRIDLLDGLLDRLRRDAQAQTDGRLPVLVLLGDYIDRGDHSREVLDRLIAEHYDPGPWDHIVYLRGNHEAALLRFLEDPKGGAAWLGYGGKQTLASYGLSPPHARPDSAELRDLAQNLAHAMGEHVRFLSRTEMSLRSGDVICAHSGIDPALPLEAQTEDSLLWGRSGLLQDGPPEGLRIVHGHWDAPEEVITPGRICVDTGAYYTGRLTAVRLDADTTVLRVDVFDL